MRTKVWSKSPEGKKYVESHRVPRKIILKQILQTWDACGLESSYSERKTHLERTSGTWNDNSKMNPIEIG
jgi:hypothetical protein